MARRLFGWCLGCVLALVLPVAAVADTTPLRLIVGSAPGSSLEDVSRVLADGLALELGRPVILDNQAGARGVAAADALLSAAPDGNTLGVVGAGTLLLNRHLYRKTGHEPATGLTPVSRFAALPLLVLTGDAEGPGSIGELGDVLRARPGACGTPGAGSVPHLTLELLMASLGARCDMVHFRQTRRAVPELIRGGIQVYVATAVTGLPLVREGQLRLLAVTSRARSPLLPEVPTVGETLLGFEAETWLALMGPRGLGEPHLSRFESAAMAVARAPAVVERLRALAAEPVGGSRRELSAAIRAQESIWGPVARAAGVSAD